MANTQQQTLHHRPQDLEFYARLGVPAPVLEPSRRLQHRLTFRNERNLYKRTSSLSGKPIVSIYRPDSPYKVFAVDEWWSDGWDALEYGRPVDFSRPFFEQFAALQREVPRIGLFNVNPYNSDYCQQAYNNKNCYLCTVIKDCEDSMYISHSNKVRDSFDCDYVQNVELCYDCVDCEKLYACVGSHHCQNSNNLYFCLDCIGCSDCIGCWGLRNQKYCMLNQQYSKEEFEALLKQLRLSRAGAYAKHQEVFFGEAKANHQRDNYNINAEDSVGKNLIGAKSCYECYDSFQIEECSYSTWIFESHHCSDIYGMGTCEWTYESIGVEKLNVAAFNTFVSDSSYAFYSDLCFYSHDIFGCVGVRRARNCILNQEYSAGEYAELRAKLVAHMQRTGEWGWFFPSNHSPFHYNESVAQERYPLSKEQALALGYGWQDRDAKDFAPQQVIVPDDSLECDKTLCASVLACAESGKNFKITPQELGFAQKQGLPLPRLCPDERYAARMRRRLISV